MQYNKKFMKHFETPQNVGTLDEKLKNVGTGIVGSPACGDVMKIQIEVNEKEIIQDIKFKTYGCGAAIASTSYTTELAKGKPIKEALNLDNDKIIKDLDLPKSKVHCSFLAKKAIKKAITDYKNKNNCQNNELE